MMSRSCNGVGNKALKKNYSKDRFSMRVLKVLGRDSSIFDTQMYVPKVTPLKNNAHLGFSVGDMC